MSVFYPQPPSDDRKVHELKCIAPFLDDVGMGRKTFEVRKWDRDFAVGDLLLLREWDGVNYGAHSVMAYVGYMLTSFDGDFGINPDHVVLGIVLPPNSFFPSQYCRDTGCAFHRTNEEYQKGRPR